MSDTPIEILVGVLALVGTAVIAIGGYLFSGWSSSEAAQRTASLSRTAATCTIYGTYYCLDAILNGLDITDILYPNTLDDDHIIHQFYIQRNVLSAMKHGFVVFKTNYDQNYKYHLIGNMEKKLMIVVEKTDWRPSNDMVVSSCRTSIRNVKNYINAYHQAFGHYVLGVRDCRHVARDFANFLKNHRLY